MDPSDFVTYPSAGVGDNLGEAYLTALDEVRIEYHPNMLCFWDVEAGQEVMPIINLLDGIPLDMQTIHHISELVNVGEARKIPITRPRHHKEVGLGYIPWEDGPG